MCCAGFPWACGLPSRAAAQGNQPMISELRAVTLVPGLEPPLSPGPQGDGNIRYYEISTEKPYQSYLMEFRSPAPQKGLGKGAPGLPWLLHYERRDWNLALGSPLPHSEKSASEGQLMDQSE